MEPGDRCRYRDWTLRRRCRTGACLLRSNRNQYPSTSDRVYDPVTNSLSTVAFYPDNTDGSVFTPLASGDVLLTGRSYGGGGSGAALFDYDTEHTSIPGNRDPAAADAGTTRRRGSPTGACSSPAVSMRAFSRSLIPVSTIRRRRTFSGSGTMAHARGSHAAILLDDGRVLVAGGSNVPPGFIMPIPTLITQAEVWNPVGGGWSPAGTVPPHLVSALARMADGRMLMAGGFDIPTVGDPG